MHPSLFSLLLSRCTSSLSYSSFICCFKCNTSGGPNTTNKNSRSGINGDGLSCCSAAAGEGTPVTEAEAAAAAATTAATYMPDTIEKRRVCRAMQSRAAAKAQVYIHLSLFAFLLLFAAVADSPYSWNTQQQTPSPLSCASCCCRFAAEPCTEAVAAELVAECMRCCSSILTTASGPRSSSCCYFCCCRCCCWFVRNPPPSRLAVRQPQRRR